MSLIRCEHHDRKFDSNLLTECPMCENDKAQRPQDPNLDGAGWSFRLTEHGGEFPDTMPQAIVATDADGVLAIDDAKCDGGFDVLRWLERFDGERDRERDARWDAMRRRG